jgi:NAD(P)-dependent dehydrogenase (short-subunit alcohol dehydrogenase family)
MRAIVTGAGGAIGSATVAALRSRGWDVVGLDLAAADGIIACDVTADASVAAAVPEAIARLGGLDALVNNAGIGGPASAGEPPDAHVLKMLDVNLIGAWRVTAAAIDALAAARGQVVFVCSRMAFIGLPLGAAYGVSKRGLTAYADALRAEYGTHVGVTCVHPAYIRTPIHDRTRAAGLELEGFSREEPLDGVVAKIVAGCEGRAGRDVAITRGGALQLAVARHLPGLVDRVVARTLRKRVAAGELDGAQIAEPLRRRHGRTR